LTLEAHIDARLSHVQLEDLEGRLTDKRCELTERVDDLERQIVVKDDCSLADAADAASLQENRLRAGGMIEQHRQVVEEIDAALVRLANGSYGVSEMTGEPIAFDRLLLIPWARTGTADKE
jgi:RNA polymerase-binding transcription factor